MMTIRVIKPGALSTLQDLGRLGYQRYGVIVDGAMDEWAHRVANSLVGNRETEATLEITLIGPTLAFETDTVIALCGGDLSPRIGNRDVPMDRPVRLRSDSVLEFGRRRAGCRTYLAVRGGYAVAPVMGSKSTYLRGGFGGFEGRALRAGDVIGIGEAEGDFPGDFADFDIGASFAAPPSPCVYRPGTNAAAAQSIRVVKGPQWPLFSSDAQRAFAESGFKITPHSDRMGYRLEGTKLALREPIEMISEGVSFGTIQVPPDGNPIILMADCQTTGGYPKIAQVASVDLPLLAQMMPGQTMCFELISLELAQQLYLAREREFRLIRESTAHLARES
jgi:urea carboxylase